MRTYYNKDIFFYGFNTLYNLKPVVSRAMFKNIFSRRNRPSKFWLNINPYLRYSLLFMRSRFITRRITRCSSLLSLKVYRHRLNWVSVRCNERVAFGFSNQFNHQALGDSEIDKSFYVSTNNSSCSTYSYYPVFVSTRRFFDLIDCSTDNLWYSQSRLLMFQNSILNVSRPFAYIRYYPLSVYLLNFFYENWVKKISGDLFFFLGLFRDVKEWVISRFLTSFFNLFLQFGHIVTSVRAGDASCLWFQPERGLVNSDKDDSYVYKWAVSDLTRSSYDNLLDAVNLSMESKVGEFVHQITEYNSLVGSYPSFIEQSSNQYFSTDACSVFADVFKKHVCGSVNLLNFFFRRQLLFVKHAFLSQYMNVARLKSLLSVFRGFVDEDFISASTLRPSRFSVFSGKGINLVFLKFLSKYSLWLYSSLYSLEEGVFLFYKNVSYDVFSRCHRKAPLLDYKSFFDLIISNNFNKLQQQALFQDGDRLVFSFNGFKKSITNDLFRSFSSFFLFPLYSINSIVENNNVNTRSVVNLSPNVGFGKDYSKVTFDFSDLETSNVTVGRRIKRLNIVRIKIVSHYINNYLLILFLFSLVGFLNSTDSIFTKPLFRLLNNKLDFFAFKRSEFNWTFKDVIQKYSFNINSALSVPYFPEYTETNYRVYTSCLLSNWFNSSVYTQPGFAHYRYKFLISGLYRNY